MAIKISGSTIIDDSRVILNADKIGIGAVSPNFDLEILSGSATGIAVSATNTQTTDTNLALRVLNNSATENFKVSYRGRVDATEYYGVFRGTIDSGVGVENANKLKVTTSSSNSEFTIPFVNNSATNGSYQDFFIDSDVATALRFNASTGHFQINGTGKDLLSIRTTANASNRGIAFQNSGNAYTAIINAENQGNDAVDLVFHVDDSNNADPDLVEERMRLTKEGNLGIGDATTNPSEKLHVHTASGEAVIKVQGATDSKLRLTAVNGDSVIQFGDGASDEAGSFQYDHGTDDLIYNRDGEKLRITSGGEVGINTTVVPYGNFAVDHGQYGLTRISEYSHILVQNKNASTTEFWNFAPRDNGSVSIGRGVPASGTGIITDEKLTILSDGNVGIGTDSPEAKLEVFSNSSSAGGIIQLTQDGTGDAAIDFQLKGTREYSLGIDNSDSDKFKLAGSAGLDSNTLLTVTNDGLVGVNYSTPRGLVDIRSHGSSDPYIPLYVSAQAAETSGANSGLTTVMLESNVHKRPELRLNNTHNGNWHESNGNTQHWRILWTASNENSQTPETAELKPTVVSNAGGAFSYFRIRVTDTVNGLADNIRLRHTYQQFYINGSKTLENTTTGLGITESLYHIGDTDTLIQFENNTINFDTAGSERLKINSSGNVLPGANGTQNFGSASQRWNILYANDVDISGDISLSGDINADDLYVSGIATFANDIHVADAIIHLGDTDTQINFGTNEIKFDTAASERLRITSNGAIQLSGGANGHLQIDDNGEFEIFESDTSLSMNNSSKIAMDFASNVARLRSSTNGTATIRPLGFFMGAVEKVRITPDGDVGIGTTNPNALLGVNVGSSVTAFNIEGTEGQLFSVTNNLSSGSIFAVNDISGTPSINVDADGTISLAPFLASDKIGIGTTNPTSKLDVDGDTKLQGNLNVTGVSTFQDNIFVGTGATVGFGTTAYFRDDASAVFGDDEGFRITRTDALASQVDSNGDQITLDQYVSILEDRGDGGLIFKSNGGGGPGAFQFFDTGWRRLLKLKSGASVEKQVVLYYGGQERLSITNEGILVSGGTTTRDFKATGVSTFVGQVGIGTDADEGDAKLTVEGTAALTNIDQTAMIRDSVNDSTAGRGGNIGFSGYVNGTQRTFAAIGGLKSTSGTGNFDGHLALYTRRNGIGTLDEVMRLESGGNVGINSTTPSEKLDVDGNIKASGSITASSFVGPITGSASQISVTNETTDTTCFPVFVKNAATTNQDPHTSTSFEYNSSSKVLISQIFQASNGNSTNVASRDKYRLWNSSAYAIGFDNGMTFGGISDYATTFQMNNQNARGWVFLDNAHSDAQGAMSLTTNGKMTLAHSLRLGYGESDTTTPGATYRLDVSGNAAINSTSNQALYLNNTNTNGQTSIAFQSAGSTKFIVGSNKDSDGNPDFFIFDDTNDKHRFNIKSDGKVGIATDDPQQQLHVVTTSAAAVPLLLERTHNDNVITQFKNSTASMYAGLADDALGWGVGTNADLGSQTNNKFMVRRSTGFVGVNNINPLANLDVRGTVLIADDIGSTQPSTFPASDVQLMVYTSTTGQPITNTNCARILIATDAKNTGAQGYNGALDFGNSDTTAANNSSQFNYRVASIMSNAAGDTSSTVADGDLQFWTKPASGSLTQRLSITSVGSVNIGGSYTQTTRKVYIDGDAEVSGTLYANINGAITPTGNVTITGDLQVNGNTTLGNATSDSFTINATPTIINDSGLFVRTASNAPTNGAQIRFTDQSSAGQIGHIRYKHPDGTVAPGSNDGFIIGGSETLTIVKVEGRALIDEKVGIGTDNPLSQLHVASATHGLVIDDQHVSGDQGIVFTTNSDSNYKAAIRMTAGGSSKGLRFMTGGFTNSEERLRISSAGKVGINETSPDWALHITEGSENARIKIERTNTSGVAGVIFKNTVQEHHIQTNGSNFDIYDSTNTSTRVRITSDGFIGINETLVVNGLTINKSGDYSHSDGNTYYQPVGKWLSAWGQVNLDDGEDHWVGFTGKYGNSSASVNISLAPNFNNTSQQAGMYIAGEATSATASDFTVGKIVSGSATGQGTSGNVRATKSELFRITSGGALQIGSSNLTGYNQFNGPGRLNIQNNSADGTVDFSQGIVFTDNVNNQGTWTHAGIVATGNSGYNGNLVFGTDNTGARENVASNISERMRITAGGSVNIGGSYTQTTRKLKVTGDAEVTGTVYAANFNGALAGTADEVKTVTRSTNANHYLTFVDSDNASATAESIYTHGRLKYNPTTHTLRARNFFADIDGGTNTNSQQIVAGDSSGSMALTINDGYGNCNLAFNHRNGTPDVTGSSGRIWTTVDSSTATMYFELGDNSTNGTTRSLTDVLYLQTNRVTPYVNVIPNADGTINLGANGTRWATTYTDALEVTNNANIGGNLTVSGTLTYDDVTNIDAVGIITARAGIDVTGGKVDIQTGLLDLSKVGGDNVIEMGKGQTGNHYAYIDMVGDATYTDYGLRILRGNSGANAQSQITHRGTGDFLISAAEAAAIKIKSNTGTSAKGLTIAGNGKVGVNVDSPQQALQVDGFIYLGPNNVNTIVHGGASVTYSSDTDIYFVADANDTSGVAPAGEFIWGGGSNTNTDSNRDFTITEFGNNGKPRNQYMILDENSLRPASNNGLDLGTSSLRFNNIYASSIVGTVSAPGNSTEILFNDGGNVVGADSGLTFDKSNHVLTVSSQTSGDCTLRIAADSDNDDESANPRLILRQDGTLDVSAIGMNFSNTTGTGNNEMFIANSVSEGAIVFLTGTTNGYTNATERLRIEGGGDLVTSSGNFLNKLNTHRMAISGGTATNSGGNLILYGNTHPTLPDVVKLRTDGTDRIYIDANGNIGINATPRTSGTIYTTVDHFLCIGDTDTGIAQDGDGQFEIWANNQEIVNFNTTQITPTKSFIPSSNGSLNLGSTTNRWGTIYATTIDGTITGTISNAQSADQVKTQSRDTNATHYVTFVTDNNGSATSETVYTDAGISYNPSTNILNLGSRAVAGNGSGSVAMTINDGYGNANLCFNHEAGVPDVNGSSGRIECSVDGTAAEMEFELWDNVTAGSATGGASTNLILRLTTGAVQVYEDLMPNSDSSRDIGSNTVRFANGYFDNVYATNINGGTGVLDLSVDYTGRSSPCAMPITVTGTSSKQINIPESSNAFGAKYVQTTEPTGNTICTGDIWYDTTAASGSSGIELTDSVEATYRNITFADDSNATDIKVNDNGRLQVRPSDGNLRVAGDIIAFYSSDARLKKNISPIKNALKKVTSISGNTFEWNEKSRNEGEDTGVIAQEVEALELPGLTTTRQDGTKAVKYEKLVPLLIEAIKELKDEINEMKANASVS